MKKRVLVVDDSALVRKQLVNLLQSSGFECEVAKNGQEAVDKALEGDYSCITMDINMPVLDGISALRQIMDKNPTPVVMISSLTTEDAPATFDALDLGAIDYVAKPGTLNADIDGNGEDIIQKVKVASRIPKRRIASRPRRAIGQKIDKEIPKAKVKESKRGEIRGVVLVGASTGGPGLIEDICAALPEDFPHPLCIVQHMPERFTAAFAQRLDRACRLEVRESTHNDEFENGVVYVAKGGTHLHFSKRVSGKVTIRAGEAKVKRFFTPSIDEMFFSALDVFEPKGILAIELTGIGDDGADGMVAIKKAGGYTIAESEESATVYGMPKEAYLRGGTCEVLPFAKILQKIITYR